jgi:hypothetical protein
LGRKSPTRDLSGNDWLQYFQVVQGDNLYVCLVCGRLPVKQALPSIVQNKTRKYVRFLNGDAISEPTMYTHLPFNAARKPLIDEGGK